MKVLVAGKGFIGEKLGEKLERSHEVKYLDLEDADHEFDITRSFSIEEEFDAMYHTIGLAPGFHTPEQYRSVHVDGTRNLIEAVETEKIVFLSALGTGEVDHSYFRTKEEAERLVKESGMDYTIIRPSTVFGEGNRLLELMHRLSFTRVFPDLPTGTQPITLHDFTELLEQVLNSHGGETLNAAGPEKLTLGEIAERIYREENRRCLRLPVPLSAAKLGLLLLSPLPPPFQRENTALLEQENTTDSNDAAEILDLQPVF